MRNIRVVMGGALAVFAAGALTACGGSSAVAGFATTGPSVAVTTTSEAPTPTAAPSTTADPNDAVCTDVQNYVADHVKPAFQRWKPDVNEFDSRIAADLRALATHMYTLQRQANGAVADAIGGEAKALTDMSVAMEEQDDSALGDAANAANSALAALRGTCNF